MDFASDILKQIDDSLSQFRDPDLSSASKGRKGGGYLRQLGALAFSFILMHGKSGELRQFENKQEGHVGHLHISLSDRELHC